MKPKWCMPEHCLTSFEVLVRRNMLICKQIFCYPFPLISLFCFPFLPYKNLCVHWNVKKGFETRVPHLLRLLASEYSTFLFISTCLKRLALVVAGSHTCVWLQVLFEEWWEHRIKWLWWESKKSSTSGVPPVRITGARGVSRTLATMASPPVAGCLISHKRLHFWQII